MVVGAALVGRRRVTRVTLAKYNGVGVYSARSPLQVHRLINRLAAPFTVTSVNYGRVRIAAGVQRIDFGLGWWTHDFNGTPVDDDRVLHEIAEAFEDPHSHFRWWS